MLIQTIINDQIGVVVSENRIKFSDADNRALKLAIGPLGVSDNHGIDIYDLHSKPIVIFPSKLLYLSFSELANDAS